MIKVAVCGAMGKMGREVVNAVSLDNETELVAAIDKFEEGKDIGTLVLGKANGIIISSDVEKTLQNVKHEVFVDFTQPSYIFENAKLYLKHLIIMNCM